MKIRCPYCGGDNIARIIWELPGAGSVAEEKEPVVYSRKAGMDDSPSWQCCDCRRRFGRQLVYSFHGKNYMPDDVCMVEFQVGGYFGGYDHIVIRCTQGFSALCVLHMPIDRDTPLFIRRYRKREWDALLRTLFERLFVHEWKSEYDNNDICDGTQWHLKLKFTDGRSREIYGSNAFPALWNQLENRFGRYIAEMRSKEADPIDILEYYHLYGHEDYSGIWIRDHMEELQRQAFLKE